MDVTAPIKLSRNNSPEVIEPRSIFESIMQESCHRIEQLAGGVTNCSYRIQTSSAEYVLRVPGEGTNSFINRAYEIENIRLMEKRFPFVPKVCYANAATGIMISEFVQGGMPMSIQDLENRAHLRMMCNSLFQLHRSNEEFTNEFDIEQMRLAYARELADRGGSIPDQLNAHLAELEDAVAFLYASYPRENVTCHGDPKLNNFLLSGGAIYLIDWEYSGMADAYFDLVNMVMTNQLDAAREQLLLDTYEDISGKPLNLEKYTLYKIATDYLWIYWHLIKITQGSMVEYNHNAWTNRLKRALGNLKKLGEM